MKINLKELSYLALFRFVKIEYFKCSLALIGLLGLHFQGFSQCDSTSTPPVISATVTGICGGGGSGGNNRMMALSSGLAVFNFWGNGPFKLEMKKATDSTYTTVANAVAANYTVTPLDASTFYDVRVTDQCENISLTQIFVLQVEEGQVTNTEQPCPDQNYTLSAEEVTDASYSWTKNGSEVSTSKDLIFAPYSQSDDGIYVCVITLNGCINKVVTVNLNSTNCGKPLPVTLINFTAKVIEKTVLLSWSTSMETNSDRFEIENSFDGKSWQKIGTVLASKESNSVRTYHYTHNNPTPGSDLYRLRMVDADMRFTYSRIQQVKIGTTGDYAVLFPNPVSERLFLNPDLIATVTEIVITDMRGHVVYTSNALPVEGINVKKFSAGIHGVRIKQKDGSELTFRVAVTK